MGALFQRRIISADARLLDRGSMGQEPVCDVLPVLHHLHDHLLRDGNGDHHLGTLQYIGFLGGGVFIPREMAVAILGPYRDLTGKVTRAVFGRVCGE